MSGSAPPQAAWDFYSRPGRTLRVANLRGTNCVPSMAGHHFSALEHLLPTYYSVILFFFFLCETFAPRPSRDEKGRLPRQPPQTLRSSSVSSTSLQHISRCFFSASKIRGRGSLFPPPPTPMYVRMLCSVNERKLHLETSAARVKELDGSLSRGNLRRQHPRVPTLPSPLPTRVSEAREVR